MWRAVSLALPLCAALQSRAVSRQTQRSATIAAAAPGDAADGVLTVSVELGDRKYPIYIGQGLLDRADLWCDKVKGADALVVSNTVVAPLYLARTVAALEKSGKRVKTLVLPDGEASKTMETMTSILDYALESRLDRACTFVALGGGVIGDVVGFAAAIYQRGVAFVQVPTTVMAMVDSSVGGKTGVNHPSGKNMIGAFYQPQCVVIDTACLDSLPKREFDSGVAEIIKYGLIRDAELFKWLEDGGIELIKQRDTAAIAYAVERSCVNKANVVADDETEKSGARATLNLGHTFGHAVETAAGYGTWLHGEAVAIGTVMAADLSKRLGWIDDDVYSRCVDLMRRADLPVALPSDHGLGADELLDLMGMDKKVENGKLRLVLLKGPIGGCTFTADFDAEILMQTLRDNTR
ncbi:3-dehydroquinate synthase AroB [Pelagophyceae sp. CCMP2097]|nr:3-dehydroquinate synthase AroB [Pelagophyceae sp. CCMP2097]